MSDVVERLGRVEYIEPNNLFVHSDENIVQNGIPQPYENYCFSVNLRVINGDRYGCGMTADGDDILNNVLEYSSEKGTLSFIDGTINGGQSYLTTNFTDISMNDPSTNTRECLGIERISIRYDSWYYPTVEITFVDVRGASLMQPAEYEYYNNGNPNPDAEKKSSSNSTFFKSFFSFPYPLFKLSVKGFYGKELTYDLSVLKTNISFNSETGNFEIVAHFIGYMYGMYADLPFPFVYIAPYIDLYGKNTWDEKRGTGDFCYIDTEKDDRKGIMMYTFPELKKLVENAGQTAEKEYGNSESGMTMSELRILTDFMDQNILFKFPFSNGNFNWWSWSNTDNKENSPGYFFIALDDTPENTQKVFEDFYLFSLSLHEYNKKVSETNYCKSRGLVYKPEFETIFQKAEEIKKSKTGTNTTDPATKKKTVTSEFTIDDAKQSLGVRIANLAFHRVDSDSEDEGKKNSELIFDGGDYGSTKKEDFTPLVNELLTRFKNNEVKSPMQRGVYENKWNIKAIAIDNIYYYNELADFVNKMKKELDELTKGLDKFRGQKIRDEIHFEPTIKNLYNMVFAHMDTFMSCFYNTLDRIRKSIQDATDDSRKYETLCGGAGSAKIEVDVSDNTLKSESSHGGKLPPFTMFYKEEPIKDSKETKLVNMWPGDLEGGKDLDEVKLVEAIVNATSLSRRGFEPVSEKDNVINLKGDLVPTNYYDIIRASENGGNPYLDIIDDKSLNGPAEIAKEIIKVFVLRCYYALLNGSYLSPLDGQEKDNSSSDVANFTKKAKLIAELEVNNVRRAFQMLKRGPSKTLINQLLGTSNDGPTVLGDFLKEKYPLFVDVNNELSYKWIKSKDAKSYMYPVGTFNLSVLDNYVKGVKEVTESDDDKFLLINKYDTNLNSFSAKLYSGGKQIESVLSKNSTGDFKDATRLFPNYKSVPKGISGVTFFKEPIQQNTLNIAQSIRTEAGKTYGEETTLKKLYSKIGNEPGPDELPRVPSARKSFAGYTSIFMDPLYYAQETTKARAYLFLMGIPYGYDKKFFIPDSIENGDYPTLMLLREGAVYWRSLFLKEYNFEGSNYGHIENDPITYTYTINGVTNDALDDIEVNDPCLGVKYVVDKIKNPSKNLTEARQRLLIKYFLNWANGFDTDIPAPVTADSKVNMEIPSPSVSFKEIEEHFGLKENISIGVGNVLISQLLTPASCSSAVTASAATSFANGNILKVIYNVEKDNKLGKVNGKIRTGVYLRSPEETEGVSENITDFLNKFSKFYFGFDTILDYSVFDSPTQNITVPRNAMNDALTAFIHGFKEYCGVTEEQLKNAKGVDSTGKQDDSYEKPEYFRSNDLKLACYMALKNIYDRWLCSRRRENWYFSIVPERLTNNGIPSDFSRFYYIDEFYHDNGMKIQPSLSKFINNVSKLGGFTEESKPENLAATSVMKILSLTAEYAGAALLTLPTMLGLARNYGDDSRSKIDEVFRAYPYNESVRSNGIETSFVTLYSNQKSSFLDNSDDKGKNAYKQDGFDIANTWGKIVPQSMFSDVSDDSFVVPCFGVTFAKQNQSYFKDIRLSMDNHQITEFSIRNEVMISYQSNMGPRETPMIGQDLYSVFSNYSYSCSVKMMGDAQITPLMYFQLNNIPMWKGAYMITNVQHNISINGFETEFTGVRQARPTVPYVQEQTNNPADSSTNQTPYKDPKEEPKAPEKEDLNISKRRLDMIDVERVKFIIFVINRMSVKKMSEGYNFIYGTLDVNVHYKDNAKEPDFITHVANTLEPYTVLKGKIEDYTPEENETYFALPSGRFTRISVENIPVNAEYRDANDSFYKFTDGKHILITDDSLLKIGDKKSTVRLNCEMVTGMTSMDKIDADDISKLSYGGTSPIFLQGSNSPDMEQSKQFDKDEIRATYREVFDLVRRMGEKIVSSSPFQTETASVSLLIKETDGLATKEIKE